MNSLQRKSGNHSFFVLHNSISSLSATKTKDENQNSSDKIMKLILEKPEISFIKNLLFHRYCIISNNFTCLATTKKRSVSLQDKKKECVKNKPLCKIIDKRSK